MDEALSDFSSGHTAYEPAANVSFILSVSNGFANPMLASSTKRNKRGPSGILADFRQQWTDDGRLAAHERQLAKTLVYSAALPKSCIVSRRTS
jgi:hypothetical protein